MHINCTDTSRFIEARDRLLNGLRDRGTVVINGEAITISKRTIQRACLTLGLNSTLAEETGDPEGSLIVKTDRNYWGNSERLRLTPDERRTLCLNEDSNGVIRLLSTFNTYPVLKRGNIPSTWWRDDQLIVERFIHNHSGRFYRVHVLLDRIAVTEAVCSGNVKKLGPDVSFKETRLYSRYKLLSERKSADAEVVHQACSVMDHLRIEFAGIDVMVDNAGRPFVVDVNTTPFAGRTSDGNLMVNHLRSAIS